MKQKTPGSAVFLFNSASQAYSANPGVVHLPRAMLQPPSLVGPESSCLGATPQFPLFPRAQVTLGVEGVPGLPLPFPTPRLLERAVSFYDLRHPSTNGTSQTQAAQIRTYPSTSTTIPIFTISMRRTAPDP